MQDIDQLPLSQWAEQLKQARELSGQDLATMAPALMLSSAQLRAIESGSLSAFHGPGYYLRAVEKYARHLNITLEPPVTELKLTDSQIALNRVKNQPSAAKLAKRESSVLGANAMPRASSRTRMGTWLAGVLLVLVGIGTWLAIDEGWPGKETAKPVAELTNGEVSDQANKELSETTATIRVEPSGNAASATANNGNNQSGTVLAATTVPIASAPAALANQPVASNSISEAATVEPTPETSLQSPASQLTITPPPAPPVAEPEPTPQPTPATTAPPPDVIEAGFNADCWVEVRFVDGRVEQGIYKPDQTLSVPVNQIERLTFGNAQAVRATRAGQAFDVNAFTRSGNNVARISARDLQPSQ